MKKTKLVSTISPAHSDGKTIYYDLKNFDAFKNDFTYVCSPMYKSFVKFKQDENGLVNFRYDEFIQQSANGAEETVLPENPNEFAYISLVTKKKYSTGTVATLHCSFDKTGAPLIVFSDDIVNDGKNNVYRLHFEVVAYNNGFNVWEIKPSYKAEGLPIAPTLIAEPKFRIDDKEFVEIKVKFGKKEITATVNGNTSTVKINNMPEHYHIGFTACEGINRFYDFKIQTK